MNDNFETELSIELIERQFRCKFAVEAAMHKLIKELNKSGWQESEVTLTLADAAEDHILRLAARMEGPQLRLA